MFSGQRFAILAMFFKYHHLPKSTAVFVMIDPLIIKYLFGNVNLELSVLMLSHTVEGGHFHQLFPNVIRGLYQSVAFLWDLYWSVTLIQRVYWSVAFLWDYSEALPFLQAYIKVLPSYDAYIEVLPS